LKDAAIEYQKAVDAEQKAVEALLNNKDKTAESWLESDVEETAKATRVMAAKHAAARKEATEARKERDKAQAEYDKAVKADEEFFAEIQKIRKEAEKVENKIKALERDIRDNPSLGLKFKKLFGR